MKKISIILLLAACSSYAGVVKVAGKTAYHDIVKPVAKVAKKTARLAVKVIY